LSTLISIVCAEINGWDYVTKSLYLAGSLKRGGRALLNELDKESRKDYNSLIRVLHTPRFKLPAK
jgi:hypothetical protein